MSDEDRLAKDCWAVLLEGAFTDLESNLLVLFSII